MLLLLLLLFFFDLPLAVTLLFVLRDGKGTSPTQHPALATKPKVAQCDKFTQWCPTAPCGTATLLLLLLFGMTWLCFEK